MFADNRNNCSTIVLARDYSLLNYFHNSFPKTFNNHKKKYFN